MFDPLGRLSCVQIRLRLLYQKLNKLKISWDDSLPQSIISELSSLLNDFLNIEHLSVNRWIGYSNKYDHEIHIFSDASKDAHGACAYLRYCDAEGTHTKLLFSKARVNPPEGLSTVSYTHLTLPTKA